MSTPPFAPELAFWDELAEAHRRRVPRVWRRPFGAAPVAAADVFAWAVRGGDAQRAGDRRSRYRIYDEAGREVATPASELPRAEDGSMAGFFARLDRRARESGLVVNNLQATCGDAWQVVRGLLAPIQARLGQSLGGASCELFAGAYRRGAFGVHKDEQDVVTLVIEGPKRFVAWPYERFADRAEVPAGTALRTVLLERFDHRAHMEDAVVLEGEPGDVIFWPAEWWHVAESDGELCTTLALGRLQGMTLARLLEEVASESLVQDAVPVLPTTLPPADEAVPTLLHALCDATVQARVAAKVLALGSTFGCLALPEPRAPTVPLDAVDTRVRGVAGAVQWRVVGDALTWAVHGAVYEYPALPALCACIERLASGEATTVGRLLALADGDVDASALAHVLALVDTHYGLERC